MGVKQHLTMQCDYCKAVETLKMPPDPKDTRHWVSMKFNRVIDGKEIGVELFFDSMKCAAQAAKKISEDKAAITKGSPLPTEPELPNKVREVVRFDEEGHSEEVKPEAKAEAAGAES